MSRKRYEIVSTCFDKKGRVLSTGVNEYSRSHTLMKHFAEKAGESSHKIWKHSELSAVLKAGDKQVHSILVQRFDAEGKPSLAKPCPTCQVMLKAFGVKVIRYTTKEGIEEYAN